ncbi:MAG: LysM peptidoglycan-binding domain-containing protein [Elusimicrobiota bacterium]|jgi:nucleoid-associated protein YgaU
MKPRLTVLFLALFLLSASVVWSENQPGSEFPAYEPPRIEDFPAAPAPATSGESAPPSEPSAPEPAAEVTPPPAMQEYRVWIWQENGDSLSMIAKKLYGDPQKWRLIYLANKDVIKDPNKIYPKQKLKIPPADWIPDNGL